MGERKGTKALEIWCRRMTNDYPLVNVENMTTSWRNGLAFCALIHHFRPDLIDFQSLRPDDVYYNNELAFRTAEKYLGIPALLDPEDMVDNVVPDRLCILTYLSQFYQKFSSSAGTPIKKVPIEKEQFDMPLVKDSQQNPDTETIDEKIPSHSRPTREPCTACGLPVFLAQRLLVARHLYHRRCFCCIQCGSQLNPSNCFEDSSGMKFCCETCHVDISKVPENSKPNDERMGMLNFSIDEPVLSSNTTTKENVSDDNTKPVPMQRKHIPSKTLQNLLQTRINKNYELDNINQKGTMATNNTFDIKDNSKSRPINSITSRIKAFERSPEKNVFRKEKSSVDINKINFMVTQLSTDEIDCPKIFQNEQVQGNPSQINTSGKLFEDNEISQVNETFTDSAIEKDILDQEICDNENLSTLMNSADETYISDSTECHIEDSSEVELSNKEVEHICESPSNLEKSKGCIRDPVETTNSNTENGSNVYNIEQTKSGKTENNTDLLILSNDASFQSVSTVTKQTSNLYPDNLNPFSDDEDEEVTDKNEVKPKTQSTNPFGSSDDDDDVTATTSAVMQDSHEPIEKLHKINNSNGRRIVPVITSYNPFWSDGEEPISEDEDYTKQQKHSTLHSHFGSTPRHVFSKKSPKKKVAPKPPVPLNDDVKTYDDTVSISSTTSSQYSNANSDKLATNQSTPKPRRKKPAPPLPPDYKLSLTGNNNSLNISNISEETFYDHTRQSYQFDHSSDNLTYDSGINLSQSLKAVIPQEFIEGDRNTGGGWRRHKGPAPGLPMPNRKRLVAPPPSALHLQLQMLEQQQRGLERQGVHLEHLIRQRCEGSDGENVPQDEVEDLVLQLCEIVNEKNELFRKQAELMHIRRQQRLEQEQADVEHEIRLLQSRPHANRTDADKTREERLVTRLVTLVSLRDELVQRLEQDRRREKAEDEAIAASIAEHRAKREERRKSMDNLADSHKKGKMKDAMKKHLLKRVTKKNSPRKQTSTSKDLDVDNFAKDKSEVKKWF